MNELDELLGLEKFDSYVQVGKGIGLVFNRASQNKSKEIKSRKGAPNVNMMMINEILISKSWEDLLNKTILAFKKYNQWLYVDDRELPLLEKSIMWLLANMEGEFNKEILHFITSYYVKALN